MTTVALRLLKHLGIPVDDINPILPDAPPDSGIYLVDTSTMFLALAGTTTGETTSLGKMCDELGIKTENMHNAGNDAEVSTPTSWAREFNVLTWLSRIVHDVRIEENDR